MRRLALAYASGQGLGKDPRAAFDWLLLLDRFTLVVESGSERGQKVTLAGTSITVGSDRGCDLILTDPTVSRKHAVFTLTPRALEVLADCRWPSNVRQLRNVVEVLGTCSKGLPVRADQARECLQAAESGTADQAAEAAALAQAEVPMMEQAEREAIVQALAKTGSKKKPAAKLLGISHVTLCARLRRQGLM